MLPTHVRKRDGRLVSFDIGKLKRSIQAALIAADDPDAAYAEDAAYAIAMHLGKAFPQQPPQTSDVAVTVARALEKGYSARASAIYLDYRVARDEQRSKTTVIKPQQISLLDADSTVSVMTGNEQNSRPWNRAFIIRALEQEAHVKHSAAEAIAQEVEKRVLSSGLSIVTTTLIRALVDSELLSRGYANSLRQRSSVTIPYDELQKRLSEPETLNSKLGSRISLPYSLSHIYSEDVAMAHRQGLIDIGGLRHPYSRHIERFEVKAETSRRELISEFKKLEDYLCNNLTLVFDSEFLKNCPRERVIETLETASAFKGTFYFSFPVSEAETAANLIRSLEPKEDLIFQFEGEIEEKEKAAGIMVELAKLGHNILWVKNDLTPISQLIAVNLPRIVYKNKEANIEQLLLDLQPSLEAAVHACRQYRLYAQANGQLRMSDIPGCELIGLREAISAFCGQDKSEESFRIASTILSASREILHRLAGAYYFDIQLVTGYGRDFGKRFSVLDERLFPEIFGFLPFHDPDAEALRHNIPPYALLETNPGDSPEEIQNWLKTVNAGCDSGFLPISVPDQQLLTNLFDYNFGLMIKGEKDAASEDERFIENRGQTSLF